MHEPSTTRRRLLQAGLATVGTTALAGCFGGSGPDGSTGGGTDPLGVVPDSARFALHADVAALLDDQALRSTLNEFLDQRSGAAGGGGMAAAMPATVSDGLDRVEETVGLDPRAVSGVAGFGGYEPQAPAAGVLWTDWSLEEIRGALSGSVDTVETETYAGRDVLEPAGAGAIAELADGTYAVGQRAHVEAVVDVAAGDASAVGGNVQAGFDATSDGALRLVFDAPDDVGEGETTVGGVDPAVFRPITHGYGAYVIDGSSRRSYLTLETESSSAAGDLQSALETLLSQARQQLQGANDRQPMVGRMRTLLDATTVSSDGASVTLSASNAEVVPLLLVAIFGSFALGLGSSQQSVAPQAIFEFEYDSGAGTVTVTHNGGDTIPANELYVRGQGFASASGTDMTAAGRWAGSTSADSGGQPAVAAGDSVTVGVSGPAYALRIVWRSSDGSRSATLAMDRGPEA